MISTYSEKIINEHFDEQFLIKRKKENFQN